MSYRSTVLSDNPLAYFTLDDFILGTIDTYSEYPTVFDTYQDVLNFYPSYSNMTHPVGYDYSGNGYDIEYTSIPDPHLLPIVPGNSMATKIDNLVNINYFASNNPNCFTTKYTSDSEFTLEAWICPRLLITCPIIYDVNNQIGIFYDGGLIKFGLGSEYLTTILPETNRAFHIVAVYSVNLMSIYIDGYLTASKSLSDFKFNNESCSFMSGPTIGFSWSTMKTESILINSVAFYKHSLSPERILAHYNEAIGIPPVQIASEGFGEIFQISDVSPSLKYKYSYPGNKGWDYFVNDYLEHDLINNALRLAYVPGNIDYSIDVYDYISFPIGISLNSSKIEWTATQGVTVWGSTDNINWFKCENGKSISGYGLTDYVNNEFATTNQLYLQITIAGSATIYRPYIKDLILSFYEDPILYASNGSSYIYSAKDDENVTSANITFGQDYSDILKRDDKNGIYVEENASFYVHTSNEVKVLEFFYTPYDLSNDSGLFESFDGNGYLASLYKWNSAGDITKTSIGSILVNNVDMLSATNISQVFKEGELYYIKIAFLGGSISGNIKFNTSIYGSTPALYQNITMYSNIDSWNKTYNNYSYYTQKDVQVIDAAGSASINMTENSVNYYNNDWKVIQTA